MPPPEPEEPKKQEDPKKPEKPAADRKKDTAVDDSQIEPRNWPFAYDIDWNAGRETRQPMTGRSPAPLRTTEQDLSINLRGQTQSLPATGESGLPFLYGSLSLVLAAVLVVLRKKMR